MYSISIAFVRAIWKARYKTLGPTIIANTFMSWSEREMETYVCLTYEIINFRKRQQRSRRFYKQTSLELGARTALCRPYLKQAYIGRTWFRQHMHVDPYYMNEQNSNNSFPLFQENYVNTYYDNIWKILVNVPIIIIWTLNRVHVK